MAFGLHRSRDLQVPGNDLDGVIKGIDFLLNVNLGYRFSIGKQVVVIGGGNVAIDVARSALREQQKSAGDAVAGSLPEQPVVERDGRRHEGVDGRFARGAAHGRA